MVDIARGRMDQGRRAGSPEQGRTGMIPTPIATRAADERRMRRVGLHPDVLLAPLLRCPDITGLLPHRPQLRGHLRILACATLTALGVNSVSRRLPPTRDRA